MNITHGKRGKFFTTSSYNRACVRGYYLVLPSGDRHWIGGSVYDAAMDINKLCDKYLSDVVGWEYWIDFCVGYDVVGNLHWGNRDYSDEVEAAGERLGWLE